MRKTNSPAVPLPGHGKRGIDGHIAYLLRQANAAVRLALERSMGELNVTLPQYLVMTMLRAYPGLSGADLARLALLTPQTIGMITQNLERLGAIEKASRASHGRALPFSLTDRGAELLDECRQRADIVEARILLELDAGDEIVIRRWLVGITNAFGVEPISQPIASLRSEKLDG